ncbi:carbohydrate esterase family 9 protein [Hebeloma cylindrosporum]|uniref:Carbohydrate esterase family 9 protein n=1 Tax=Hebeloma cylindrosporum TaxID=76867 RepID=A0A0C2YGU2_HEBCY|nr:carbohydrate esterase family 9 protein [Hebeloma cylindrosporum h7]
MTSPNGLICFTNCLLPQEDGSLVQKDLWVDERRGVILDAQKTFYKRRERPNRNIDMGGNIVSPGFLDIQINGAYGFDFSVYEDDDEAYHKGVQMVAERIVETGVTSLLPTIITQEKSVYPKLLSLLKPFSNSKSATFLGWHAEGPFIDLTKRGAHTPGYLLPAVEGFKSFEEVYGAANLVEREDWAMSEDDQNPGVRLVTAAPEIPGVMDALAELNKRGIAFSIGHSVASTDVATAAVQNGARLITHLFNAMPQLHHRDPSIIGLLGASPWLSSPFNPLPTVLPCTLDHLPPFELPASMHEGGASTPTGKFSGSPQASFAALEETPAHTKRQEAGAGSPSSNLPTRKQSRPSLHLDKGQIADMSFERPYYGLIVDGIHCHPNSVRLAYSSHPEGCILITDAMKILDPNLRDGVYEWREGRYFEKRGEGLYLEGTTTLAGSLVTLDKCVRNLSRFTGCSLGEAIRCATYNPAKCLGIEDKKGTLRPGAHADFVVLDRQGIVLSTWVKGKEVWVKGA